MTQRTSRVSIDEMMAVFKAEASRIPARPADARQPNRRDDARMSYDELLEEAKAIEAEWLDTQAALPVETGDEPDREHDALVTEAIAIEAAWLASRRSPQPDNDGEPPKPRAGRRLLRFGRMAWNLVSWAGVVAVAAAMLAIAALIVVPKALGWQGMVVLSGSMEPALNVGGLAFVEPLDEDELGQVQPGDIITFRTDRLTALISHRVVEVIPGEEGPSFVTRGDANSAADATPVTADRVAGKVRFDVPYLGRLVEKLQNRNTYYLFIGLPAALLIATELWSVGGEVQRYRRERAAGGNVEGAYS